jgi:small subunit ribosomal protein S1
MSEESAESVDVPAEVVAVEGTVSDEEVHNNERPARASGIKKHKGGDTGTPLSELVVGSTVKGTVKTITTYGAFLDIGAASDALLHVSRMSDDFTSNPADVVSSGQEVDVRIVSVDQEKNQVAVTMQSEAAEAKTAGARGDSGGRRKERPQRSGGDRAAQKAAIDALDSKGFEAGKFIEGQVVNTLDFGAFVRVDISQLGEGLEGEIDGLVHISALSEGRAESVTSIVKTGDKVQVRVKNVDTKGGKVGLSMISMEAEAKIEEGRKSRGGGGRGARNAMFRPDEMGPTNWKETLETMKEAQPEFKNMFIVEDKKKQVA